MYATFKLLDGYSMDDTDGYTFVTPWLDVHSAPFFSLIAKFSGDPIANGTLKLQMSNDRQTTAAGVFPVSAGSSTGDPDDLADVPASLTGTVSQTISATGVYVFQQYLFPGRWVRLSFSKTGSPNTSTVVDVFAHFKG